MKKIVAGLALALLLLGAVIVPGAALASDPPALSVGGEIMVPAYSYIFIGDKARPFQLAATLCLRNTSTEQEVTLLAVDYYDTEGKLVKKYLNSPQGLAALGSLVFTVAESEREGGAGAKFMVRWSSPKLVSPPLAEAVMIGTGNQQGISFTSRGQALPPKP